jgi:hypothetical protein
MAVNLPVVAVDVGDTVELIGPTEGNYIVPREAAGWKMVNCSMRTSPPIFRACFPRTLVRLSVKTQLFCFSMEGRNPELPEAPAPEVHATDLDPAKAPDAPLALPELPADGPVRKLRGGL